MLKGIDPLLNADLLYALAAMGHGDELVIADSNFPATSVAEGSILVRLEGADVPRAAKAILSVFPLDSFVEAPLHRMEVVGDPDAVPAVQQEVHAAACEAEGSDVTMAGIERFAFYDRARQAFAVVQTGEPRPYGCVILTKGVVFD